MTASRRLLARAAAGAAVVCVVACTGKGNTGRTEVDPKLLGEVPWIYGAVPVIPIDPNGSPILPPVEFPPVLTGEPDPGSKPVDCKAWSEVELSPWYVDTFEPERSLPTYIGVAPAWSSYDDQTKGAFRVPGDVSWYAKQDYDTPWGMPADKIAGPSCDGKPNNWALHMKGGQFINWGSGASHLFAALPSPQALTNPLFANKYPDINCPAGADFCPPEPGATTDSAGLPVKSPSSGEAYQQLHTFWDLSNYEGIAFWARRGPEGQISMLVSLTMKFTSDTLARENQTYCRRLRECHTACANEQPCSPDNSTDPPIYRCFDPSNGSLPGVAIPAQAAGVPSSLTDLLYPRCGKSACTSPTSYVDKDFDDKECRPYTFLGDNRGEFCFDAGEKPPDRDDRCGNDFTRAVQLTTDWKFYTLPFSEFQQGTYGKLAPYFDAKSVAGIALGFSIGWADSYVDNVTFYRRKK